MKRILIGLAGYAGVGKNTIADALGYPQYAFAKALKDDLAPVFQGLGLNINNPAHKAKGRALLVAYGELARVVDPFHWINRLDAQRVRDDLGGPVVITDLRYANEVTYVLNSGGVVFYIYRPGFGPANETEEKSFAAIFRNQEQGFIDYIPVLNAGTPEEAANQIREHLGLPTVATNVFSEKPITESLDAEAAVLAHPAWQKLQQYPEGFPVEKIEEGPHTIDLDSALDWDKCDTLDGVTPLPTLDGDWNYPSQSEWFWRIRGEVVVMVHNGKEYPSTSRVDDIVLRIKEGVLVRNTFGVPAVGFPLPELAAPPGYYFEHLPLPDGNGVLQRTSSKLWAFLKWLAN